MANAETHEVLEMCGMLEEEHRNRLIENEGFANLADLAVMEGDSDVELMAKRLMSRVAAERVTLGTLQIKNLQALVWWIHNRMVHNQALVAAAFDAEALAASRMQKRVEKERADTDATVSGLPKFKPEEFDRPDKPNATDDPRRLARWLGISHRVGSDMTYWLITESGKLISKTSVEHVIRDDYLKPETKARIDRFNEQLTQRLDDSNFLLDPEVDGKFHFILSDEDTDENPGVNYDAGVTPTDEEYGDSSWVHRDGILVLVAFEDVVFALHLIRHGARR